MADNYWIQHDGGGTGNWSDTGHWSLGHAPDATENVFFDASSFNGAGQTVTVDAAATCLDMNWTGVTNSPTFTVTNNVSIYGTSTIFSNAMTVSGAGALEWRTVGTCSLNTNGTTLNCLLWVSTSTANLSLGSNIIIGNKTFYFDKGTITTNGFTLLSTGVLTANYATQRTLTLSNSTVSFTNIDVTGANFTLTPNNSTINCSGLFYGGGYTNWNIVNLTGATSTITGSNTFAQLNLASGTTQTITFTDTTTQTITTPSLSGSAGHVHTLQGSGAGGWNLAVPANTNFDYTYISVSRSTVTGGGILYAGAGSTDGGNNVAWAFGKLTVLRGRNVAAAAHNTASDIYKWGSGSGCVLYLNGQQDPQSGVIKDLSGYSNHGTITGATWVRLPSGLMVNSFDGTDDIINCGSGASLDAITGNVTSLAWINATSLGEGNVGVVLRKGDFGSGSGFFLSCVGAQTIRAVVYVGGVAKVCPMADNSITFGKWALAAMTNDGSNVTAYVNQASGVPTASGAITDHSVSDLCMGNDKGTAYTFLGYIALPRIFNTALSATQINGIFQSERGLFGV
jgi:hypothetical protein